MSPARLAAGATALVVLLVLIALLARGAGLRWDPFDLDRRGRVAAEAEAARARRDAAARAGEVEGERRLQTRAADHARTLGATAAVTAVAAAEARTADDAETLLDPLRGQRLRAHDRELCRLAPDLAGCAAAPDPG